MLRSQIWACLAACFTLVAAATTSAELDLITQATKQYPPCALACLTKLVPQSACKLTDLQCLCTNEELTQKTSVCVLASCTLYEGLQTQNVTMTMCGAPVRDKHIVPLTVSIAGGTLATLAFAMRMAAIMTRGQGRSIGLDDCLCGAALLLAAPPTLTALSFRDNGLGKDIWTLKLDQITNVLMLYYLGSVFYIASITFVKLSIITFILRVFPDRKFRTICYIIMGLVAAYGISFVNATALQCWPASYAWTQVANPAGGSCNNVHLQAWCAAAFNIALDLTILVLPLHQLWMLQMGLKKKVMIMVMFSLGIFVTIISVIRLHSLITFANSINITWDYVEAGYWSLIEMHVSIICACLPYCRHLLVSLGARFLQSTQQKSSQYMYGSRSRSRKNSGADALNNHSSKSSATAGITELDGSGQQSPRRGDEGSFVPLVDYPDYKPYVGGGGGQGAARTTTTVSAASRKGSVNFSRPRRSSESITP